MVMLSQQDPENVASVPDPLFTDGSDFAEVGMGTRLDCLPLPLSSLIPPPCPTFTPDSIPSPTFPSGPGSPLYPAQVSQWTCPS